MKKITLLLTMLSALSISACDKSNDQAAVEAPDQAIEATEVAKDASIENAAGLVENATTPATDDAATEVAAPATEEKK